MQNPYFCKMFVGSLKNIFLQKFWLYTPIPICFAKYVDKKFQDTTEIPMISFENPKIFLYILYEEKT